MSEPIKDGCELNEGQKGDGKFFEPGADPTMAFDAAEEVFDFVPPTIIAAVKGRWTATQTLGWDADAGALAAQPRAKGVGGEALVANAPPPPQATEQRLDGEEIVALPLSQAECDGAPATLDDGCQLGVEPSFGASDGLCSLSAAGIRPILVQLDVRTIDRAQLPLSRPSRQPRACGRTVPWRTNAGSAYRPNPTDQSAQADRATEFRCAKHRTSPRT